MFLRRGFALYALRKSLIPMHQPRTARTVRSLRVSALSFLLLVLTIGVTVPLVVYALIENNRQLLGIALGLIGFAAILLLVYRISGSSARCSLCSCPVMFSQSCSRNRNAKTVFGSYRTRVACSIVLTNKFTCPYCGEATQCVPRQRSSRPQPISHPREPHHGQY